MATTVLGVGLGVFIIILVWILTLVFAIILLRGSGSTKLLVIPLLLLAIFITSTLVFFPRRSETTSPVREKEIVDSFFIGRYVLLSVVSAVFVVALFMMLPLHFLEPVYAKPLRTH